ncbi:hypothetical protein [Vibrio profundi]|uniref:hypothetical protein n=1 Tax=Vibrio profundi TaxID=1774960 RepID=UPI003736B8EB
MDEPKPHNESFPKHLVKALCALTVLAMSAKLYVVFTYEINWDEFYYLSFVHQYIGQYLINSFQTFHIHFFTWLQLLSNNEVDQIIAARSIMWLLQLFTGYLIFRISRIHLSLTASLFSVLAYFSLSYGLRMGASFRTDPIATALLLMTTHYLFQAKLSHLKSIFFGVITSCALLVTLKSSLYGLALAPIVLISLYYSANRRQYFGHICSFVGSILLSFAVLHTWHSVQIGGDNLLDDLLTMFGAADKTLNQRVLFPGWPYFVHTFTSDIGYWLTLLTGIAFAIYSSIKHVPFSREVSLKFLSLSLLLATLLFYRNAFPYYYSFMLAPVSVLLGFTWHCTATLRSKRLRQTFMLTTLSLFFVSIVLNGWLIPSQRSNQYQSAYLDRIHQIFPKPVPYIDRCSMVSTFPKFGFFMSTWGYENYISRGEPTITEAVMKDAPVFVIENTVFLNTLSSENKQTWLLPEDELSLNSHYIHHWEDVYIAGKHIELSEQQPVVEINIAIPGVYTLESEASVIVNQRPLYPGQTLFLAKSTHSIRSNDHFGIYTFRWGNHTFRPEALDKEAQLFTGF